MVFFTRCSGKYSRLFALIACALSLFFFAAAHAEGIEVRNAALVAGEEGYFLEADFEFVSDCHGEPPELARWCKTRHGGACLLQHI